MSLLDTFLLEPTPLKTPTANAFFVALRTDGVLGSGTMDDPWDGSTIRSPGVSATFDWTDRTEEILLWSYIEPDIALLELLEDWPVTTEVTVTTAAPHGFVTGDVIAIGNVAPEEAAAYFAHDFPVTRISDTQCQFTIITPPFGIEPFTGMTIGKVVFRLDEVLKHFGTPAVLKNTLLYLGSGIFETRGTAAGGNQQDGQHICGSGIENTILKLVVAAEPPALDLGYGVIGWTGSSAPVTSYEVADLTADANMRAHPYGTPYSFIHKIAVQALGQHIRFRRIRAVDFGTQTMGHECFPLIIGGQHPGWSEMLNDVIDDCIIERPSPNNVRETTCMGVGGPGPIPPFHRGCVIRNCVLDCRYWNPNTGEYSTSQTIHISDITKVEGYTHRYKLTTLVPHGRTTDNNVNVSGVRYYAHPFSTAFNTSVDPFPVVAIPTSTTVEITTFNDPEELPFPEPLLSSSRYSFDDATISGGIAVEKIERLGVHSYLVTTKEAHGLSPGTLTLTISGVTYLIDGLWSAFNQVFLIDHVTDTTIEITLPKNPEEIGEPAVTTTNVAAYAAFFGVSFHGPGVDAGTGGVAERNRVYHLRLGSNHDSWPSKDSIYVYNYYSGVVTGPFHSMGAEWLPLSGSAISHDGAIARFTSLVAHGLHTGDPVTIKYGIGPDYAGRPTLENPYNRDATVLDVIDANTFTYAADVPSYYPNATSAPLFKVNGEASWRIGKAVVRLSGDPATALFAVASSGDLPAVDDHLEITGIHVNGDADTPYNGVYSGSDLYKVTAVDGLTFQYKMSGGPGTDTPSYAPWFEKGGVKSVGTSILRSDDLATFTASYFHGLLPGQGVHVQGAVDPGATPDPLVNDFNSYFEVESVPASPHIDGKPTSFTYRMKGVPTANASGNPVWSEYWRVRQLAIERNVIELTPDGAAFTVVSATRGAPYLRVFRRVIARGECGAVARRRVFRIGPFWRHGGLRKSIGAEQYLWSVAKRWKDRLGSGG